MKYLIPALALLTACTPAERKPATPVPMSEVLGPSVITVRACADGKTTIRRLPDGRLAWYRNHYVDLASGDLSSVEAAYLPAGMQPQEFCS